MFLINLVIFISSYFNYYSCRLRFHHIKDESNWNISNFINLLKTGRIRIQVNLTAVTGSACHCVTGHIKSVGFHPFHVFDPNFYINFFSTFSHRYYRNYGIIMMEFSRFSPFRRFHIFDANFYINYCFRIFSQVLLELRHRIELC